MHWKDIRKQIFTEAINNDYVVLVDDGKGKKQRVSVIATDEKSAKEKALKQNPGMKKATVVSGSIDEALSVSDGIDAWIRDFQNSDNPKFDGKSKEKRREMAIAAFMAAKK